ncbi:hypothetical protein RFM26_04290 [Mesorhizobium sp. VK23B]|uniref:Uncharacterized protein n=1 Tax=Mesorhizobium dulcispinae TaxID=3072316 RepID=A0ABU4XH68_9HYPH|nr:MULTISPECIES: hypothetical protein [unclassified Mesorhizobium]MDX8464899.1 hypothetical protein [Mesorhizobium sp. VK23B]MDX8472884.1 hypothetical protein [Mesorhizobium sp. VK23A]
MNWHPKMWRPTATTISFALLWFCTSANAAAVIIGNTTDSEVMFVIGNVTTALGPSQISAYPCESETIPFAIGTTNRQPIEIKISCNLSYAIYFDSSGGTYLVKPYNFGAVQQQLPQVQQQQQDFAPNIHELLKQGLPGFRF